MSAASSGKRRRLALIAIAVIAAITVGVFFLMSDTPPEPPLPSDLTEAEVRDVLEKSQARVKENPRSGEAWGDYGTLLLSHLFDREAETCFIEASKLDANDPRWPYARAQIAMKRRPEEAVGLLEAAINASTFKAQYRPAIAMTLAETLLERGETDRAARLFEEELSNRPDEPRALFGMALVARARNDDASAARMLERIKSNPYCRKQAAAQLAQLASLRGDTEAAKKYEGEANTLEADAPWPDPYLDHLVTLQVGSRGRQRKIGRLENAGEFEKALEEYNIQLREKKTAQALTGAGVNLARLGRYEPALAHLREAVQLDPNDSRAHYTLALVLFTQAEKRFVEDPSSADAAKAFREVVQEAKRATELKSDSSQAYLFWGLSLLHLGEPKDAIEPLKKGLVIQPEGFELHFGLGQAFAAAGDAKGAEDSFRTAKKIRPDDPRPDIELAKLKRK